MKSGIKKYAKKLRALFNHLLAEQTTLHLETIRHYELHRVVKTFPRGGKILEIGAGAGWQAGELQKLGYEVSAIDIEESNLINERIYPVINYDGHIIPFEDNYFDIIFSSNVLEHVPHILQFQSEIHRVLKPGGGSSTYCTLKPLAFLVEYYRNVKKMEISLGSW